MYKPLLQAVLALLFTIPAIAQRNFPNRKLHPDPKRSGSHSDTSQIKRSQARQGYNSKELARITDSISPKPSSTHPSAILSSVSSPLSNRCGTKASFTPANDTTLYTGQSISFTNTSQNADSYEWFNDVNNLTTTTDFTNFVPNIGVTQIMLVAHRGACTDTAMTYIVRNGTPPTDPKRMITTYGLPVSHELAQQITNAKTDGYLLAGTTNSSVTGWSPVPYFVRVSENGCILWSRTLLINYSTFVRSIINTFDSGFVAIVVNRSDIDKSLLLKFDKNGNILWSRSYSGTNGQNWTGTVRELSDHSLMVLPAGEYNGRKFIMTCFDEQGDFRWQKEYMVNNQHNVLFTDLASQNGSAWVAGIYYQVIDAPNAQLNQFPMIFKVDIATGNLQWSKGYVSPNKNYSVSGIHFYKDGLIMNGFADSLFIPIGSYRGYFETLLETDLDGNIREGKLIYNTEEQHFPFGPNNLIDNLIVNADNSVSLFYSGFGNQVDPVVSCYLRLDAGKNILWQNLYSGYLGSRSQATTTPLKGLAMLGENVTSLQVPLFGISKNLLLVKVDSNGKGPDPSCNIYETKSTMQDMSVTPYSPGTFIITDEILQPVDLPVIAINPNTELRYTCPDYVPLCSFMKLSGDNSVCNLKDTLEFIAHKDPSCADPVKWTYDVTNIKTVYEDGNRTRLIFKTPGTYKILAEKPFPCTAIADSIMVRVAPGLVNFNLGGDTTLCTGDSIVLRPLGKYDLYQWQDLSASDSFKVKTAGLYHCLVTDSCGNTKADTIQVDFRSSIPIDLGLPRSKCAADSLTITPPPGFQRYDWGPLYNLIPSSDGTVVLYPAKDTSYQLTVHDKSGCAGSAELKINVFPVNPVVLGNDTAVCDGVHVIFSAGGNFQTYTWSNGETAAFVDVKLSGAYAVLVRDQNNCKSSDTVRLTVYPLPEVHITGGEVLCKNQDLVLDAGAGFVDYVWQDGSQQEKFNASDTGNYRVQVTDLHHCASSDSIHIAGYAESPQGFLPTDTAVCLDRGGTIQSRGDFSQYNWSNGETGKSIKIKTAGIYELQVVDLQGCVGKDSVVVTTKNCEALLVFPNAFTPNHDGLNDVFRLKYPGFADNYKLQIFNRWGQMIYQTSDPYGEWDGSFANDLQPTGTYIWIARFTDRSGKKQQMEGTVVLIR